MKRSSSVRLTLMAAAAAGLSACEPGVVQPGAFKQVADCVDAGNGASVCDRAYQDAVKSHWEKAPRYASISECLQRVDTQQCVEVRDPITGAPPAAGSSPGVGFIPALAGFTLARAAQAGSGGGGGSGGAIYASRDYPGRYRDSSNLIESRTNLSNSNLGNTRSTPTLAPAPSRPPNVNTTTVARSGFGSTSSFRGGSGS